MIVLDSSGIIALTLSQDRMHSSAVEVIKKSRPPFIVPAGILSEVTYTLEARGGHKPVLAFVSDLEAGRYALDCGERDFTRIWQLVNRYSDMPLGFADASVMACAERRGGVVLTYDFRHFPVVAREGTFRLASGPSN